MEELEDTGLSREEIILSKSQVKYTIMQERYSIKS